MNTREIRVILESLTLGFDVLRDRTHRVDGACWVLHAPLVKNGTLGKACTHVTAHIGITEPHTITEDDIRGLLQTGFQELKVLLLQRDARIADEAWETVKRLASADFTVSVKG